MSDLFDERYELGGVLGSGGTGTVHRAVDRLLGYGLKYATDFRDTHLGRVGAEQPVAAAH